MVRLGWDVSLPRALVLYFKSLRNNKPTNIQGASNSRKNNELTLQR